MAVNLAPAAQPAVPRPVAAFPAERRRPMPQPAASPWNGVVRRTAVVVLAVLAAGQAAYIGARLFATPPRRARPSSRWIRCPTGRKCSSTANAAA